MLRGFSADKSRKQAVNLTFSAVTLEIGPWNQGSRASRAACACEDSGSAGTSPGDDADADDEDAAEDDVNGAAVNGSVTRKIGS